MLVLLFRILILLAIILLVYTWIEYLRSPERKMRLAKDLNQFYLSDDPDNSKKNLRFVYKGCTFEGEKYVGISEDAFEVTNIHISVCNPMELKGITREDLYFLESELLKLYPFASIEWKHPIDQLVISPIE